MNGMYIVYLETYKVYIIYIVLIATDWHPLRQGHDSVPGIDVMLLKQQFLQVSSQATTPARQKPHVEYMLLRQLGLPLRGVWALTSSELSWAVPDGPT